MKIEYFRQEALRLEALINKLRVIQGSRYHDRVKATMLCLDGQGITLDECEMILDDIDRYIEEDKSDNEIIMLLMLDYYCIAIDDEDDEEDDSEMNIARW